MDATAIECQFPKFLIYTGINSSKPKGVLKTINPDDKKVPRTYLHACSSCSYRHSRSKDSEKVLGKQCPLKK